MTEDTKVPAPVRKEYPLPAPSKDYTAMSDDELVETWKKNQSAQRRGTLPYLC